MNRSQTAYYERNREAVIARNREWAKAHPEKVRAGKARRYATKYRFSRLGITAEQYADLLTAQNGRCAICDSPDSGSSTWCVDHDHKTNEVRGLLCQGCNIALGHYEKRIQANQARFDAYLKIPPAKSIKSNKLTLVQKLGS